MACWCLEGNELRETLILIVVLQGHADLNVSLLNVTFWLNEEVGELSLDNRVDQSSGGGWLSRHSLCDLPTAVLLL